MNPQGTQLDPSVVALTKAIGQSESGGNYTAKGKSGEHGAYQYTAPTWSSDSQKYLGQNVPLEKATPAQQDEVAYKKVYDLGKQGYKPDQIASIWNSGKPDYQGNVGTNKYGVRFDTPAYVKSVGKAYETIRSGGQAGIDPSNPSSVGSNGGYNPNPYSNPSPGQFDLTGSVEGAKTTSDTSLGGELSGRMNDLSQAVTDTTSGKINPISGLIQGAGAIAGGLGDVVNKGLELIPGFKNLENLLGEGVGKLAQTQAGQAVGKAIQDFSTAHPELSKDIGAGFNIITAIPILKGLGALKNVAMDGVSIALKNVAEKGAIKDLTEVASRTVGGRAVLNDVPEAVKTLVSERAIPNVTKTVGGKLVYSSDEAAKTISTAINKIDQGELQPILEQVSKNQNFGQNLATLKKLAIQEVENDASLKEAGAVPQALKQIENRFSGWQHSYGDTVDLATENRLKIGTGKFSDWRTAEGSADKAIYRALQGNIEDVAKTNGLGDVAAINQKMANLIKAQKLLRYIESKAVKNTGMVHGLIQGASIAGGEVAGNAMGIPFAGALIGGKTSGLIERTLGAVSPRSITNNILERTAKGATRQTVKGLVKRTAGMAAASMASQANR